ncbi:MAG: hypothetical protein NW223_21510 [Hyphomicrobiaceae bacterium]|nr:hypothetical protein [Hyphomicrobiaceae bacterium]
MSLTLSGCSDGVSLSGGLFDAIGISDSALSQKSSEPKLAERAPLVLPPNAQRLPEPGSGAEPEKGDMNWPEQRKIADAKERERLHLAYCRGEIEWQKRALDPNNSTPNKSPYGPCPGVGELFKKSMNINN